MKLFIGCSSSNDLDSIYYEESKLFLEEVLKDNDLVYGAYNKGIMSIAYEIAHLYNRDVLAITTDRYKDELNSIDGVYKSSKENIFRRTEELVKQSDIVIILPGGIGTISEMFSIIETVRNNEFNKPILIYNIENFFDKLIEFMEKIYNEKFSSTSDKRYYCVVNTLEDALEYINSCKE